MTSSVNKTLWKRTIKTWTRFWQHQHRSFIMKVASTTSLPKCQTPLRSVTKSSKWTKSIQISAIAGHLPRMAGVTTDRTIKGNKIRIIITSLIISIMISILTTKAKSQAKEPTKIYSSKWTPSQIRNTTNLTNSIKIQEWVVGSEASLATWRAKWLQMVKKSKVILEGRNSNDQMSLLKIMPNLPKRAAIQKIPLMSQTIW